MKSKSEKDKHLAMNSLKTATFLRLMHSKVNTFYVDQRKIVCLCACVSVTAKKITKVHVTETTMTITAVEGARTTVATTLLQTITAPTTIS